MALLKPTPPCFPDRLALFPSGQDTTFCLVLFAQWICKQGTKTHSIEPTADRSNKILVSFTVPTARMASMSAARHLRPQRESDRLGAPHPGRLSRRPRLHGQRAVIASQFEVAASALGPDGTLPVDRQSAAARVELLGRKQRLQSVAADAAREADAEFL